MVLVFKVGDAVLVIDLVHLNLHVKFFRIQSVKCSPRLLQLFLKIEHQHIFFTESLVILNAAILVFHYLLHRHDLRLLALLKFLYFLL